MGLAVFAAGPANFLNQRKEAELGKVYSETIALDHPDYDRRQFYRLLYHVPYAKF